jgi:hypothetical protein
MSGRRLRMENHGNPPFLSSPAALPPGLADHLSLALKNTHDVISPTRIRVLLSCGLFQDALFFSVGVSGALGF